jgi:hypothetical protein
MEIKQILLILSNQVGSFEPKTPVQTLEQIGKQDFSHPARVGNAVLIYTPKWADAVNPGTGSAEYHSSVVRPDGRCTDTGALTDYHPLKQFGVMTGLLTNWDKSNVVITHPNREADVVSALAGYEIIKT